MNEPEKINIQELLKITDKSEKIISFDQTKLEGEATIQDYPELEEIYLPNHEITSLKISDCPQLVSINVHNNQLTSLELTNCPSLKKLMVADNPLLTQIKGLNLATIKNINLINTGVNLAQEIEELKRKNKNLTKTLKEIDEGVAQNKLVLTEPIQTPKQAEEAIQRHLKKVEREWREDLARPEPRLPSFRIPTERQKAKQILIWVIEAQTDKDYWKLVEKWNKSRDYDPEKPECDFDGNLGSLVELLKVQKRINQTNLTTYEQQ